MLELDVDLGHIRVEHANGLLEQLLTGFVAFEDDDAGFSHSRWRLDDSTVVQRVREAGRGR